MEKVYIYSKKGGWINREGLFLFDKPVFKIEYINGITRLNGKEININPLILIEKLVKKFNLFSLGFISYNYGKKLVLGKKFPQITDVDIPEIYALFFKNYKEIPLDSLNFNQKNKVFNLKINCSKERFVQLVKKAKKYIEEGDIYQVNLTHRLDLKGVFYPEQIFYNLIKFQSTPYLMLIKDTEFSLISASMELFLKKEGNKIISKPIKGTIGRGSTKEEDFNNYIKLKNSEKEQAENLMITDLMRNDLGRIAQRGTVNVPKLFEIERYTSLYQMSSTVEATIKEDLNLLKIIDLTFPPGSVTGAPKKRAMEIIAELEEFNRTVYCGTTFLIKPDMDFTMSVAIRQSILKNDSCYIYVGSGIVANSIPEMEYEETLLKAKANIKAIASDILLYQF